ncbi:MAG: polysaccharide biosynthesis C-terminal domain-containing protein [Bacteroidota bacterium]
MINKIAGTIFSRLLNAVISLAVVIIISHQLGARGVGTVSLVLLGITIIQMVSGFIGGSALIYLVPRFHSVSLLLPSYAWSVVSGFTCSFLLFLLRLVPAAYIWHVLMLSIFLSLATVNLNIILGREKVAAFNIISSLQMIIMIASISIMIFIFGRKDVFSYILALYCSYVFLFISSSAVCIRLLASQKDNPKEKVLKNLLKYGSFVQTANILQLFNYRLCYYFVEYFISRAALGIFSVGVQVSEGLWLTGKSMSVVQYSKISNTDDREYAKRITLVFGKISFIITLLLLAILLLLPSSFFTSLFGNDFSDLPIVIFYLAAGILFLSMSFSFSHYFSGIGKHHHNSISSFIGLVLTVCFGVWLIPAYGLPGAAVATSLSYSAILTYQVFFFLKLSSSRLKDILITGNDIEIFYTEIKKILKKS